MLDKFSHLWRTALATVAAAVTAQAHVDFIAPNGGETFAAGSVVQIQWTIAIAHNLQNWDLWYSPHGPNGPWTPIVTDYNAGSATVGSVHTYDWTVPDSPSSTARLRIRMDNSATDYYDVTAADITITSSCAEPSNYCATATNSVGSGATMSYLGSVGIATNDFELRVVDAVPGQNGIFFYGSAQGQVPFGEGNLCVSGQVFRLNPPLVVNNNGTKKRLLDFTAPPADSGPGAILSSSTWNFQFWYRDPAGGGSNFNLSDGLAVMFCP